VIGAARKSEIGNAALSCPTAAYTARRDAERIADIGLLGFGFAGGVAASAMLLAAALPGGKPRLVIGVGVYVAGLLAMLGCSLLYRAAPDPQQRQFFRRLDHAAIFAMIAGSATPFALASGGYRGIVAAAALWAVAVLGIAVKLRYPIGSVGRSAIFYLVLGWASLAAVGPALSGKTVLLIAAGGAFYSAGVPFLLWRRLPYRFAIWHGFVLAGAACHYLAILDRVLFA
jgi:hemolysin III